MLDSADSRRESKSQISQTIRQRTTWNVVHVFLILLESSSRSTGRVQQFQGCRLHTWIFPFRKVKGSSSSSRVVGFTRHIVATVPSVELMAQA